MAALPGLKFRPALAVTTSSTASTYVAPGGPAVGMGLAFAMLRGWGFRGRRRHRRRHASTRCGTSSSSSGTRRIALAALLSSEGGTNPLLQTAALDRHRHLHRDAGGLRAGAAQRATGGARWANLRARICPRLLRVIRRDAGRLGERTSCDSDATPWVCWRTRWHWLTLASMAGHLTVYLVLILTLRAARTSRPTRFRSSSPLRRGRSSRILGSIPITPGGFGVVELGLTGALVAIGGPQAEVVAAVLVYRLLTVVPPILLGAFFGRRGGGIIPVSNRGRSSRKRLAGRVWKPRLRRYNTTNAISEKWIAEPATTNTWKTSW